MPFYLRKSVRAGPFRFNFSKGGVGVSIGMKGLRFGTGPRGHYVNAGRGGIYYRASIGHAGEAKGNNAPRLSLKQKQIIVFNESGVTMLEVDSGDVLAMRDEVFAGVLDEINAKQKQIKISTVFAVLTIAITGLVCAVAGPGGVFAAILALPMWGVGRWIDSFRRSTVLFYDLETEIQAAFEKVTNRFDTLMACSGKWHVEAGGVVRDTTTWKRNAGASHIVQRKPTELAYQLPKVVKCNVTPPALHVGKQVIYFFPDMILVQDGDRFGAVGYADLNLQWQNSNFIEDGKVPHDAEVIRYTWKHPNKSGGPDRRFRNNHQIPVCRYETMLLSSKSGINEIVEFSRTGACEDFVRSLNCLPKQSFPSSLS